MDISFFIVFCFAPIMLLNYLSIKPQKRLIDLYREKINSNELFYPKELTKKYGSNPIRFARDTPRMMRIRYKVFFGSFHDKDLDKLAHEIRFYYYTMIVIIILNFAAFIYFINNS